ncbi:MAG: preprotein translocase subunit SecG [Bacteroidetes bacterium]|nr:preprotein translocase subunit SecG [Bacteroidota bacterium]
MYIFLTVLIVIACVFLILIVLVQNPKGGGLSATFGGGSTQYFGVQRTTDFLEKATWGLAIAVFVLSLGMNVFLDKSDKDSPGTATGIPVANPGAGQFPIAPPVDEGPPPDLDPLNN